MYTSFYSHHSKCHFVGGSLADDGKICDKRVKVNDFFWKEEIFAIWNSQCMTVNQIRYEFIRWRLWIISFLEKAIKAKTKEKKITFFDEDTDRQDELTHRSWLRNIFFSLLVTSRSVSLSVFSFSFYLQQIYAYFFLASSFIRCSIFLCSKLLLLYVLDNIENKMLAESK